MTFVAVCLIDPPAPLELHLGELNIVAYLERKNGGAVAVVAGDAELNEEWVEDARAQLMYAEQYWSVPDYTSEENRVAWAFTEADDGSRRVLEIAIQEEPIAQQRGLAAQFEGSIRDWEELPVPGRSGIDFCAVLQVPPGNGTPQLYVDSRAKCDHRHLAEDAERLLADFRRGHIDSGWDRLPDRSFITGIIIRDTARSHGIIDC